MKRTRTFMLIRAAMVAAGFFVEFVVCYGDLLAQEPRNEKPVQSPDSWIGKQVVTKYSAGVRVENQKPNPGWIFRVYTVQELKGTQVRLVSGSVSGWIESTEVLLFDKPIDFYSQEIRSKPKIAAAYHQRGLIWKFKGEND
jgi:hypothetical protein